MRGDGAPSRVYAPELGEPGSTLVLSAEESHYLVRVCRARPGDRTEATDGRGGVASLRLVSVAGGVEAEVEASSRTTRRRRAWVLCGAPEGSRADWLVEKLAELGVERWQPVDCERGAWTRATGRVERWRRLAVAGLRQARRCHLLEVMYPAEIGTALVGVPEGAAGWLASREGAREVGRSDPDRVAVGVIGPAGGLTAAEEGGIQALGFSRICLSDGRLRTETAALAWSVWWSMSG